MFDVMEGEDEGELPYVMLNALYEHFYNESKIR